MQARFGRTHFFLDQFDGDLIIGLRHILLEEDLAVKDFEPALDIFEAQADIALVQLVKVGLGNPSSIVVEADEELVAAGVLGQVDKAGIAVFQDVVDQFLDDPEDDELVFGLEPFPVIVKTGAGVHAAGAADLLEQIIYCGFETKVLERWRHQRMADIANELDGVVDDLFGVVDALQLGGFVEVDEVFVEVQAGCGEEGAGVVVEVGGDPLAFFFLEPDAGVEEEFLLVLFHALEPQLVADDLSLVEDDEDDQPDSKRQHPDSAKEKHKGNGATGISDF